MPKIPAKGIQSLVKSYDFEGGFKIKWVRDAKGKPLSYFINKTMMRLDLPTPLESGKQVSFQLAWTYNINDRMLDFGALRL